MEKTTKKYVTRKIWGKEWEKKEIDNVAVKEVDTSEITCFCFLEQSFITDTDGEVYEGKIKQISPTYFVGKRLTIDEALQLDEIQQSEFTRNWLLKTKQQNPNACVCKTDYGYIEIMWNPEDITLEEYQKSKGESLN